MEWNNGAIALLLAMFFGLAFLIYLLLKIAIRTSSFALWIQEKRQHSLFIYIMIELALACFAIASTVAVLILIRELRGGKGLLQ